LLEEKLQRQKQVKLEMLSNFEKRMQSSVKQNKNKELANRYRLRDQSDPKIRFDIDRLDYFQVQQESYTSREKQEKSSQLRIRSVVKLPFNFDGQNLTPQAKALPKPKHYPFKHEVVMKDPLKHRSPSLTSVHSSGMETSRMQPQFSHLPQD
jgi:hypothetical protein